MSTERELNRAPKGGVILKRVGAVLIVVGLVDIAYMVYFFSTGGSSYSSSFNIIAVVAGYFLRKGDLRATQFAGFFVRFGLVGVTLGLLVTPAIYPFALIKTFLAITPVLKLLGWAAYFIALLVLLVWLDRNLQSSEVRALLIDARLHEKWPRLPPSLIKLTTIFSILAVGMVALFQYMNMTETSKFAVAKAREQFELGYSYHVSAMSISSTPRGRTVYASVIVYSDSEIEKVRITWED